jgi:hypothetical protein
MKRAHRKWQRRAWVLLAPAAAAVIALALLWRSDVPTNADWPGFLAPATQAGSKG